MCPFVVALIAIFVGVAVRRERAPDERLNVVMSGHRCYWEALSGSELMLCERSGLGTVAGGRRSFSGSGDGARAVSVAVDADTEEIAVD